MKAYLVFEYKQEPYGFVFMQRTFEFVFAAEYLQFISSLSKNYTFQLNHYPLDSECNNENVFGISCKIMLNLDILI